MVHQRQNTRIDWKPALGGPISAIPPPPRYLPISTYPVPTQYTPTYLISSYVTNIHLLTHIYVGTYLFNINLPSTVPTHSPPAYPILSTYPIYTYLSNINLPSTIPTHSPLAYPILVPTQYQPTNPISSYVTNIHPLTHIHLPIQYLPSTVPTYSPPAYPILSTYPI